MNKPDPDYPMLSDIIAQLQAILADQGDLPCVYEDWAIPQPAVKTRWDGLKVVDLAQN
jgi:hypothetical protein